MEDYNGAREADRGIRDSAKGNADPNSDAGHAGAESGPGLEGLAARIKDLTALGGRDESASQSNETFLLPVKQFQTDVIVGWRTWRLVSWKLFKAQSEVQLESIVYPMIWHPAKPVEASVGLGVASGVHAWQKHAQCIAHAKLYGGYARDWILGEVSLWGHVIKHENGYRAQYAYPRRLIVPECLSEHGDIVGDLRRTYGIECEWA